MLPPCCTDPLTGEDRPVHSPVPVVTQYATADLIDRIAYEGHDPADDPAWRTTGAPTRSAYGRWCRHMCGIACLRMALLHRDGKAPDLFELLAGARHYNAYTEERDGIRGLIYAPFAQYTLNTHDLPAQVHPELTLDDTIGLLEGGRMVMVSVSKEIRRPETDPERRGGHLVLAIGLWRDRVVFRNPSGHTPQAREASLPIDRFGAFSGGRGVSLDLSRSRRHGRTQQGAGR